MRNLWIAAPIFFSCLLFFTGEAEARYTGCSGGTVRLLKNQTVDRYMTLRAGKSCSVSLTGSSGPTHGVFITERPKHGTVTINGPHKVIYRANAAYAGSDSFIYARKGLDELNKPNTMSVRVNVTVQR